MTETPAPVDRALMIHTWSQLGFVHWPYEPAAVQRLLPDGLTVDEFDGAAWIGLVPFNLAIRLPYMPAVPWVSRFPEANIRTYVLGPDGEPGIWFISLDAARLGAVAIARATYPLPYMWADLRIAKIGDVVVYDSRRRAPGPRGATCRLTIEVGDPLNENDLTPLDTFLTARWRFFTASRRGLSSSPAVHEPWPLARARVLHLEQELLGAAGLPRPDAPPQALYSEQVVTRIGRPKLVAPHRRGARYPLRREEAAQARI